MSNQLQLPYQDVVGSESPVQKAIKLLRDIANEKPITIANTEASKSASALILVHLLGLMDAAGLINCRGYHSAAITLFRSMEDALDCFAAVSISNEAAVKWTDGSLKSSDAAKLWIENLKIKFNTNFSITEYRKSVRLFLNKYSHCTPNQTHWNLYLESIGNHKCTIEINTLPLVINLNEYHIDRYICAHLYELIEIVLIVYKQYWEANPHIKGQIEVLQGDIKSIIEVFLSDIEKNNIDITVAPELKRIPELNIKGNKGEEK